MLLMRFWHPELTQVRRQRGGTERGGAVGAALRERAEWRRLRFGSPRPRLCGVAVRRWLRAARGVARRGAACGARRASLTRSLALLQLERIAIQFLFDAADDDSKTGLKDAERAAHKKLRALMG